MLGSQLSPHRSGVSDMRPGARIDPADSSLTLDSFGTCEEGRKCSTFNCVFIRFTLSTIEISVLQSTVKKTKKRHFL